MTSTSQDTRKLTGDNHKRFFSNYNILMEDRKQKTARRQLKSDIHGNNRSGGSHKYTNNGRFRGNGNTNQFRGNGSN